MCFLRNSLVALNALETFLSLEKEAPSLEMLGALAYSAALLPTLKKAMR